MLTIFVMEEIRNTTAKMQMRVYDNLLLFFILLVYFLNEHINRLKDKGILNVDYIMNSLFKDSVVLLEEQRPILERGFKAFIEKDYIVLATCWFQCLNPLFVYCVKLMVVIL